MNAARVIASFSSAMWAWSALYAGRLPRDFLPTFGALIHDTTSRPTKDLGALPLLNTDNALVPDSVLVINEISYLRSPKFRGDSAWRSSAVHCTNSPPSSTGSSSPEPPAAHGS